MTGRGRAPRRPRWCTATRRDAAPSMQWRCSRASPACCKPTPMPPIAASPTPSAPAARSRLAYCWSHCRREFFDLAKSAPAPIATEALQADRRILPDRSRNPRHQRRSAPGCPTAENQAADRSAENLARKNAGPASRRIGNRQSHPLRAQSMGRAHPLPRRRPHRDRLQFRRARHAPGGPYQKKCTHSPAATKGQKTGRCSPR